jgi:hypothetical protein
MNESPKNAVVVFGRRGLATSVVVTEVDARHLLKEAQKAGQPCEAQIADVQSPYSMERLLEYPEMKLRHEQMLTRVQRNLDASAAIGAVGDALDGVNRQSLLALISAYDAVREERLHAKAFDGKASHGFRH